jgi:hypothetical protein
MEIPGISHQHKGKSFTPYPDCKVSGTNPGSEGTLQQIQCVKEK